MFDQNDQNQPVAATTAAPAVDVTAAVPPVNDPAIAPVVDVSAPSTAPAAPTADLTAPAIEPVDAMSSTDSFNTTTLPNPDPVVAPTSEASDPAPEVAPEPTPAVDLSLPAIDPASSPATDAPSSSDTSSTDPGLLALKQQALQSLSPLLSQLDQSPEEKFRTTMMMIQASDDQSLIQAAYDAANAIPDEKAKAQALLDVVNEINYFTQNKQQTPPAA